MQVDVAHLEVAKVARTRTQASRSTPRGGPGLNTPYHHPMPQIGQPCGAGPAIGRAPQPPAHHAEDMVGDVVADPLTGLGAEEGLVGTPGVPWRRSPSDATVGQGGALYAESHCPLNLLGTNLRDRLLSLLSRVAPDTSAELETLREET